MKLLDSMGRPIENKKFNFFVSKKKYAELKQMQLEEGYSSVSAVIRELVDERKLRIVVEQYSLDRAIWSLILISDLISYMSIDMNELLCGQLDAIEHPGQLSDIEMAGIQCAADRVLVEPVAEIITKLSLKWLQE